jgi:hypothetical protein
MTAAMLRAAGGGVESGGGPRGTLEGVPKRPVDDPQPYSKGDWYWHTVWRLRGLELPAFC